MVPMFTAALLTKSNTWKQPTSMNEGMDKNMWHFTHTHIHAQWNIVNKPGMLWFRGSQRVGHDWVTELNWTAPFSWVLGHKVLFVPSKSLFPSPVKVLLWGYWCSKRAYTKPRSAAPRASAPVAVHCWPGHHRRCSDTVLSQPLWGPHVLVCTRSVWASEHLW